MYDELIKTMRHCVATMNCVSCPVESVDESAKAQQRCLTVVLAQAADAIEELSKGLEAVNDAHNEGYDVGYWAGRRDYEPKWIPVTERLPKDNEAVNVTWINRDPESYYQHIKDKPFVATGVYYQGQWYWWSAVVEDILAEYGKCDFEKIDEAIDITHWMPLPEPPKEET